MSHDTDDVFDSISDAICWGPSPSTPAGFILYLILIVIVVMIAYSYTSQEDDACRAMAGENYNRIDGVCYRVNTDGTLLPVDIP